MHLHLHSLSSSEWLFGTGLTPSYSLSNAQTHVFLFLTAVNCGTLTSPVNGRVSHTAGTTFGKTATYSCNTGYDLVGSSARTCQSTRRWSGSAPTCQGNYFVELASNAILLYSRKYWQSLNLAVWPQTDLKKKKEIWRWHLRSVYQGALSSLAEVLEQSHKIANLQEMKLAAC